MTDDEHEYEISDFYDAIEEIGRPVLTADEVARVLDCSHEEANRILEKLADERDVARLDVENDPVVWFPTEWERLADRERIVVFPKRREIIADQPEQFTRAQLSQFAHLTDTTPTGGYSYQVRQEDIWSAPYESLDDLMRTVRQVLPEPSPDLEEFIEGQWKRAKQFRLYTHEDGYVVLQAASDDLMGNVARQKLNEDHLRAPIADDESWVAEDKVAEVKRILYEAGYPVQDERELETGDELPVKCALDLRDYQREWVEEFIDLKSGVLVGPPGSGKTVAAMGVLEAVAGETLILVPGRELAGQWHDELLAHTNLTPEQVGEYHGGEKNVRPVTIATYQTAGMDRHRQLFDQRRWGLIVYDECLTGETIVETKGGKTTFERVDEEYELEDGWTTDVEMDVRTFNPRTNEFEWDTVTGVYKTEAPVQRIETNTGKTLRASPGHTHVIFDPETGELREQTGIDEGDFLVQPFPKPSEREGIDTKPEYQKYPRVELLGWFIGDGHLNKYRDIKFAFARHAEEQIGIVKSLCDALGAEYSIFDNSRGDKTLWAPKLQDRLNWNGAPGNKAATVTAPDESYTWPKQKTGAFLRGLFDAEGSVDAKSRIEFNTTSRSLAADVELLLQKLGILTRRITIERENKAHNTLYRLTIPSFYGPRFDRYVGFRLQHKSSRVDTGTSPAIGLPVGPFLKSIKNDLDCTNAKLGEMAGVSGITLGDVICGSYRLGQHRLQTLASSLHEYADSSRDDIVELREEYDITYEHLAQRLGSSTGGVYGRLERNESEAVNELRQTVEEKKQIAKEHARTIETVSNLHIEEVTNVKAEPTETVYDFETESHTFIADGFLTHNCQHIPSRVFRRSANLQSKHRLGLSATPVREDDKEKDIFTLIGPPIGTDWDALFEAGFVAEPEVEIRYVGWDDETYHGEYATADGRGKRQIAAMNPAKLDEIRFLLAEHPTSKALVFVEYLEQGDQIAEALGVPFLSGKMRHPERERHLQAFRDGREDTLVISRVGDEGIDLPDAEIAIVASGLGGSRRQGAQRAGRTMRPAGRARMYVLATRGTREEEFARQQLRHLASKGIRIQETVLDERDEQEEQ